MLTCSSWPDDPQGCSIDSTALRKRDPWLVLADHEHVVQACCESVSQRVLHVDNIHRSHVPLTIRKCSHSSDIVTAADDDSVSSFKLNVIQNFTGCDIKTNCVINLDIGIRETDCAPVMSDRIRGVLWSSHDFLHSAKNTPYAVTHDRIRGVLWSSHDFLHS